MECLEAVFIICSPSVERSSIVATCDALHSTALDCIVVQPFGHCHRYKPFHTLNTTPERSGMWVSCARLSWFMRIECDKYHSRQITSNLWSSFKSIILVQRRCLVFCLASHVQMVVFPSRIDSCFRFFFRLHFVMDISYICVVKLEQYLSTASDERYSWKYLNASLMWWAHL